MLAFTLLLAFVWGVGMAVFAQRTELGKWLSIHLTWFIVAAGMGGNLLIMLVLMDEGWRVSWLELVGIIFVSSIGPAGGGIIESYHYFMKLLQANGYQDKST